MKNIIEEIGYDYNIEIVELEVPVDHIHRWLDLSLKSLPQTLCKLLRVLLRGNFSGEVNYGHKVILSRL